MNIDMISSADPSRLERFRAWREENPTKAKMVKCAALIIVSIFAIGLVLAALHLGKVDFPHKFSAHWQSAGKLSIGGAGFGVGVLGTLSVIGIYKYCKSKEDFKEYRPKLPSDSVFKYEKVS